MINRICLLLFSIGVSLTISYGQEIDCPSVKTGKFKLVDEELGFSYLIERNDSIQIETKLDTEVKTYFKISWIDPCNYELKIVQGEAEIMEYYKTRNLKVQITKITPQGYAYTARIDGVDRELSFYVTRVDEK